MKCLKQQMLKKTYSTYFWLLQTIHRGNHLQQGNYPVVVSPMCVMIYRSCWVCYLLSFFLWILLQVVQVHTCFSPFNFGIRLIEQTKCFYERRRRKNVSFWTVFPKNPRRKRYFPHLLLHFSLEKNVESVRFHTAEEKCRNVLNI